MMDANLKRIYASHVMIVLRLINYLWGNQCRKEADLLINLPVGLSVFKLEHHEPLVVAFLLHVVNIREWSLSWGIKGIDLVSRDQ